MKYLLNRAIYQLSFFDKARKEGYIEINFRSLYDGITSLYCLNETEKQEIISYFNNETFNLINSFNVARFHLDFLDKMSFKTELFGSTENEKFALCSKRDALEYYEKLFDGNTDLISVFERNNENRQVSFSFSLLHYLVFKNIPDKLFAQLRKNASSKDSPDFDSLIFLLKTDANNLEQYKSIFKKSSFKFFGSDYERLNQRYFKTKEKDYDSGKISQ